MTMRFIPATVAYECDDCQTVYRPGRDGDNCIDDVPPGWVCVVFTDRASTRALPEPRVERHTVLLCSACYVQDRWLLALNHIARVSELATARDKDRAARNHRDG